MREAKRRAVLIGARIVAPPVAVALFYAPTFLRLPSVRMNPLEPVRLLSFVVGAWLLWFALAGYSRSKHGLLGLVALGGVLVGGIGSLGGFFIPLYFWPDSNQGPLLGCILGPFGFVLGCLAGVLIWAWIYQSKAAQ
jgi:hypothetical protein